MVEGLYRGWDELRSVPGGSQSGLRVIVLFTDGASNSVQAFTTCPVLERHANLRLSAESLAIRTARPGTTLTSRGSTTPRQAAGDLRHSVALGRHYRSGGTSCVGQDVAGDEHSHALSQLGHPDDVSAADQPCSTSTAFRRTRFADCGIRSRHGVYPAQIWNINNAARNLVEIIAQRGTEGHQRRLQDPHLHDRHGPAGAAGPGNQRYRETSESILKRISNDNTSSDFNAAQLEGKYFYAQTAADVAPAFQGIQNQILRLSK